MLNRRTQAAPLPTELDVDVERRGEGRGDSYKGAESKVLLWIGVEPLKICVNSGCSGNGPKSSDTSQESVAPPSATRGLPGLQVFAFLNEEGEARRGGTCVWISAAAL